MKTYENLIVDFCLIVIKGNTHIIFHNSTTISKTKFKELWLTQLRKCIQPIVCILQDAEISKSQIHEISLDGGSTRISNI